MDFQPEIYGPYSPYMDFLLEIMVRRFINDLLRGEMTEDVQILCFLRKIQNFRMAISTIAAGPHP